MDITESEGEFDNKSNSLFGDPSSTSSFAPSGSPNSDDQSIDEGYKQDNEKEPSEKSSPVSRNQLFARMSASGFASQGHFVSRSPSATSSFSVPSSMSGGESSSSQGSRSELKYRSDGKKYVEKGSLTEAQLIKAKERATAAKRKRDATLEEKKEARRASNRLCAFQARQRSKQAAKELQDRIADLSKEGEELRKKKVTIKSQLMTASEVNVMLRKELATASRNAPGTSSMPFSCDLLSTVPQATGQQQQQQQRTRLAFANTLQGGFVGRSHVRLVVDEVLQQAPSAAGLNELHQLLQERLVRLQQQRAAGANGKNY